MSGGRIDWWPPAAAGGLELPDIEQMHMIIEHWLAPREDLPGDRWWSWRVERSARLWSREGLPLGRIAAWPVGRDILSPDDVHWTVGARMVAGDASTACWWAACGVGDAAIERAFVPSSMGELSQWWLANQERDCPAEIAPPVTCPRCLAMQAEGRTGLEQVIDWPQLPLEAARA